MVTTEDVEEGVAQLWNAAPAITALVTGGLILGRVQQAAGSPYTSYKVEDGEIVVREAQGGYLQKFKVTFKTWDQAGAANAGPIKVAIEGVFSSLAQSSPLTSRKVLTLASTRTLAILESQKVPGGLDEDEATQQAQAVKIATDAYEFLCQG